MADFLEMLKDEDNFTTTENGGCCTQVNQKCLP